VSQRRIVLEEKVLEEEEENQKGGRKLCSTDEVKIGSWNLSNTWMKSWIAVNYSSGIEW